MRMFLIMLVCACCLVACTPAKSDSVRVAPMPDKPASAKPVPSNPVLPDFAGQTLDLTNIDQDQKMALVSAKWRVHFPLPDNTWGYTFKKNGQFDYVNNSDSALMQRYRFTKGNWKLEDNQIQVQLSSYTKTDHDPVEDVLGLQFPDGTQYLKVPITDETWYTIGDLSDIVEKQVKGGYEIPMQLPLKTILFDQLSETKVVHIRYSSQ